MKKFSLVILLAVAVLLPGCALLDMIPGWGDGGTHSAGVNAGWIDFSFYGVVTQQGKSDNPHRTLGGTFNAGNKAAAYDPATHTFTATWNGGGYTNTYMQIRFNAAEDFVEYFHARQTLYTLGWWTTYEIEGYDVPYSHSDNDYRYFQFTGVRTHTILTKCVYKAWSNSLGTATSPYYALKGQSVTNLSSDGTSYIRVRINK